MKQLNKIFFAVFALLWGALTVGNFFNRPAEFSENENRVLAKVPLFTLNSFVEGDYMRRLDDYVNDHFLLRDTWISVQSTTEYAFGKRESNGVFIGNNALVPKLSAPSEKVIAENLAGIRSFTKAYGLPSYLMLVPDAAAIQPKSLPPFAPVQNELAMIENIHAQLPEVQPVPVAQALLTQPEKNLYYRTDHHWTTYGAYLGASAFCSTAGLPAFDYTAATVSDAFNGTLYSNSGVRFVSPDTVEAFQTPYDGGCTVEENGEASQYPSVYFPEYLTQKNKYAYFLGTNKAMVTLHGTANTGKKLLVFKDSYAHCLAPMLLQCYDEIALVDLRYTHGSIDLLVSPTQFDSVLYLYSLDTFTQQNVLRRLEARTQ